MQLSGLTAAAQCEQKLWQHEWACSPPNRRKLTANTQKAMWAAGQLSWHWQDPWVMTERSVGKVKWRARSLERGKEKKRRREGGTQRVKEGQRKGKRRWRSATVASQAWPSDWPGKAGRTDLRVRPLGMGIKWKRSIRSLISTKSPQSQTNTAVKCCHSNTKKRKLYLFMDPSCNCVKANFKVDIWILFCD